MQHSMPFLERVRIQNYKSIQACDVTLRPATFLVGPNASGKSNFLDALDFLALFLESSLDKALHESGGWDAVRHRPHESPSRFLIAIDVRLAENAKATYEIEIEGDGTSGLSPV